jgi:protein-tyrosine phosphatase
VALDERIVPFEACFNFRDLGGYPTTDGRTVRWGHLYRSDTLHRLTGADLASFAALGLHTAIDLRTATELEDYGFLSEEGRGGLSWHHVPFFDAVMRLRPGGANELAELRHLSESEPDQPGQSYAHMLGDGTGCARVFELLVGSGSLPAVFHCTSGKDRTGMVAAMTLDLLGVDDDVIADDYILTNETRHRSSAWIKENEPEFAAFLAQIPPERRHTRPDTIVGFLDEVRRRFGSVEKLLIEHQIPAERLEAFRDTMLQG